MLTSTIECNNPRKVINSINQLIELITPIYKQKNIVAIENIELKFELKLADMLTNYFQMPHELSQVTCDKEIYFCNVEAEKINFDSIIFDNKVTIAYCTFNDYGINSGLHIYDSTFSSDLSIENSTFYTDQEWSLKIENGNFTINNCRFNKSLSIRKFQLSLKTEFTILGKTVIDRNLSLLYGVSPGTIDIRCEVLGDLSFQSINNGNGCGFNMGELRLDSAAIHCATIFLDCSFKNIDILKVYFTKEIFEKNLTYNIISCDAAIVLKDHAVKSNNTFLIQKHTAEVFDRKLREDSAIVLENVIRTILNLRQKRIITFRSRRKYTIYFLEPLLLFLTSFWSDERLTLWLNKYSNNYNRSWFAGVRFTLTIAIFSYFMINYFGLNTPIFIIDWRCDNFGEVSLGFLKIIDIFNLCNITNNYFDLTPLGQYIMFISKILISFGIYQTLYAFYKSKY
ncbi:MAG: hypothetical protein ACRC3Z_12160 [Phocaeicola sp.]